MCLASALMYFRDRDRKMWGILRVKPELIKDNMDRILLWDLYDAMINETWEQLFEMKI